ncbi:MAG: trimethylamine corrinoid protein 2 [Spirochaetota bacterium]
MFGTADWDMVKKRWTAFWNNDIVDRCLVSVQAPLSHAPKETITDAEEIRRYWTDPERIVKRQRDTMKRTYLAGDAFHVYWHNLGASGHAGYFRDANYEFGQNTMWFHPSVPSRDAMPEFEPEGFLYSKTLDIARYLSAEAGQEFVVSMPDCSGNVDALASLRGSENVLVDMIDAPDAVRRSLRKIQGVYERTYDDVMPILAKNNDGGSSIGWLRTWAPGLHAQMQSDISVMISPESFNEFVAEELRTQCDYLDYPLYHFDGIEQIRHLDTLLSIKKLRAIQWTQVAGQPKATEHIDVLTRIQKSGKALLICVNPDQIRPLMSALSSKGLALITTAKSADEADAIVSQVQSLTHD